MKQSYLGCRRSMRSYPRFIGCPFVARVKIARNKDPSRGDVAASSHVERKFVLAGSSFNGHIQIRLARIEPQSIICDHDSTSYGFTRMDHMKAAHPCQSKFLNLPRHTPFLATRPRTTMASAANLKGES